MKTYLFKVVLEPDEEGWHVYCPALRGQGAVTWGGTKEAALANIKEVIEMILEELKEEGARIPDQPKEEVIVSDESWISIAT